MRRMRDITERERPEAVVTDTKDGCCGSKDTTATRINNKRVNSTGLFVSGCGFKGTY